MKGIQGFDSSESRVVQAISTSSAAQLGTHQIDTYRAILQEDPTRLDVYHSLIPLVDSAEKTRLLFQGISHALDVRAIDVARTFCQQGIYHTRSGFVASRNRLPPIAFGRAAWKELLDVDVDEEPPLPLNIDEILADICADWKTVEQACVLALIPKSFSKTKRKTCCFGMFGVGEVTKSYPMTLANFDKLVKSKGSPGINRNFTDDGFEIVADWQNEEAHWVLMTLDVIEGSRGKFFYEQIALVRQAGGDMPDVLDAVTCILIKHLQSGQYLFRDTRFNGTDTALTYTFCRDIFDPCDPITMYGARFIVGGFNSSGLGVRMIFIDADKGIGVALAGVVRPLSIQIDQANSS